MAYKRVTKEERRLIHRWRQEGLGPRELGRRLGRSAGSISREIHRNSGRRGYRPKQAHALAQHRARRAGPRRFTLEVRVNAEKRLREGWTPEIISGRARLEGRAWVDEKLLKIPADRFRRADLSCPLNLERRFDLAICLEVAEHLPPERADGFVAELAGAADFVLFSAAIPFQGGYGHVNEQWPSYWAERFAARGFAVRDWVRPRLWTDVSIPNWYRENLLLFVAERRLAELAPAPDGAADGPMPLDLVHPEAYLSKVDPDSWRLGLAVFRRALKKRRKK